MHPLARGIAAAALALAASIASAAPYSSLFVFGDSLSDSGNNAAVFDSIAGGARTPTPIANQAFIPSFPYSSNRYSNGAVWVEYLAGALGLSAAPSLAGGTNFAYGGATSGPISGPEGFPFSLLAQTQQFLAGAASIPAAVRTNALYIIAGGGNDVRAILGGADPATVIGNFANNTATIIGNLAAAGARNFLIVNVPDVGKTPALQTANLLTPGAAAAATGASAAMNNALSLVLAGLPANLRAGIDVLDAFGLTNAVFANPGAFGFANTAACAASVPCIAAPNSFFWDGIHPTTAGHQLVAAAALRAIPEPATLVLVACMLAALVVTRRRAQARALVRERAAR